MENKDIVRMVQEKDPKVVSEIKVKILDKMNEAKLPDAGETFMFTKDVDGYKKGTEMEVQLADNQFIAVKIADKEKIFNIQDWKRLPIKLK